MDFLQYFDVTQWGISGIDLTVLVGYLVLMSVVGYLCRKTSSNISDYIRMGAKSTWWLLGLSIFMQAVSSITFTANCAQAYLGGWSAFLTTLGGAFGLIVQGVFIAGWMRKTRAVTPADAVRARFGPVVEQITVYVGAFGGTFWGGVMLLGLSSFISAVFNVPVGVVIIFAGVVIIFYSVSGGSWSVMITDSLQSMIMIPICLALAYLALQYVGGIDGLLAGIRDNGLSGDYKMVVENDHVYQSTAGKIGRGYYTWAWVAASFLNTLIVSINMSGCWRYLSAKTDADARKAAFFAAFLITCGSFIWFIPPMVARISFEEDVEALAKTQVVETVEAAAGDDAGEGGETLVIDDAPAKAADSEATIANATDSETTIASADTDNKDESKPAWKKADLSNPADGAYAVIAKKILPPGLLGLVIIAMFAAAMSSLDSALTGTAGLVTKNIYPPLSRLVGLKPIEGKPLLTATKVINLLLGIWAMSMAMWLNKNSGEAGIYQICLNIVLLIATPIGLPIATSFFLKRLPWWGPIAGMVCGFTMSTVFMFGKGWTWVHWDLNVIGIDYVFDLPYLLKEKILWHHKMYINTCITLIPTIATTMFWNTSSQSYKDQVAFFFKQLSTPVDFKEEVGESEDHTQLSMVGGLGLIIAAAIACLLFVTPTEENMNGFYTVIFVSGTIGLISGYMYLKGKKIQAKMEAKQAGSDEGSEE